MVFVAETLLKGITFWLCQAFLTQGNPYRSPSPVPLPLLHLSLPLCPLSWAVLGLTWRGSITYYLLHGGGGGRRVTCYVTTLLCMKHNLKTSMFVWLSEIERRATRSNKDRLLTSSNSFKNNLQPNQKHLGQNFYFLNGVAWFIHCCIYVPNIAEHLRYILYELGYTHRMAPPWHKTIFYALVKCRLSTVVFIHLRGKKNKMAYLSYLSTINNSMYPLLVW